MEWIRDQCEEIGCTVDYLSGGFVKVSPNLHQKLLSMSSAGALRPGFFLMRRESKAMPSLAL